MSESFQPGDLVKLKSGSPAMTVTSVDASSQEIVCEWFRQGSDRLPAEFVKNSFPCAALAFAKKRSHKVKAAD